MSRADRFDRADFEARYVQPGPADAPPESAPAASVATPVPSMRPSAHAELVSSPARHLAARGQSMQWPIAGAALQRVGESVLTDRNGQGRPHKGIDLFAEAGTEVRAASEGKVLRVVDGRHSAQQAQRRAGLFVDVQGSDALVQRYLHLAESRVAAGALVQQGTVLGRVAAPHTSGLAHAPHLHFEVRQGDFDRTRKDYGAPLDPLRLLPPLRA